MKKIDQMKDVPKKAVILGAGLSGLLAAEVLSERFDQVIVVERNTLSLSRPTFRSGIPQAKQFHVLLNSGLSVLENLLPGVNSELDELGVPLVDYTKDCILFSPLGKVPRFPSKLMIRPTERPVLDFIILQRDLKNSKTKILDGLHCKKLNLKSEKIESLEGVKRTKC